MASTPPVTFSSAIYADENSNDAFAFGVGTKTSARGGSSHGGRGRDRGTVNRWAPVGYCSEDEDDDVEDGANSEDIGENGMKITDEF